MWDDAYEVGVEHEHLKGLSEIKAHLQTFSTLDITQVKLEQRLEYGAEGGESRSGST